MPASLAHAPSERTWNFTSPGRGYGARSELSDRLAPAVAALDRALTRVPSRHMLIGGVAVIAHGVRRLTDDVDATLWADGVDIPSLLATLEKEHIVPRIDDAVAFARRSQVLLLRHSTSGVDIDLSLAWLPFENEALKRAGTISMGRRRVLVARPEDLVVYKAMAARERDKSDVERLLEIHRASINLARVRRTVLELAEALERPDLAEGLEIIIRRINSGRGPRTPRRPRRRSRG